MTLPAQMADRWHHRTEPVPGEGTAYWHILMRDQAQITALAQQARQRLGTLRRRTAHDTPRMAAHDYPRRRASSELH